MIKKIRLPVATGFCLFIAACSTVPKHAVGDINGSTAPVPNPLISKPTHTEVNTSKPAKAEFVPIADDSKFSVLYPDTSLQAEPSISGTAIKQLVSGQVCQITGRTSYIETQNGLTDYWYKATCHDQNGWIFGARTSNRLAGRSQTLRAAFDKVDMGDYFHLIFKSQDPTQTGWRCPELTGGEEGWWDFGFGAKNNKVGEYAVFDPDRVDPSDLFDGMMAAANKYKGKMFKIVWTVKECITPEGGGGYGSVKREVPVIIGLSLE